MLAPRILAAASASCIAIRTVILPLFSTTPVKFGNGLTQSWCGTQYGAVCLNRHLRSIRSVWVYTKTTGTGVTLLL